MKDVVLQIKDLCYGYEQDQLAVSHLTLSFCKGERIAVIGANGSGKSTLFLNLNGVLTPDSGTIICGGIEINKKNRTFLRQQVGFVFQDADQQMIAPSVEMEVSFGPMNLKLPIEEVKNRTEQAMRDMDLKSLARRSPHSLSGGEKKRVSIADVLAMESQVILLDEPTTALDPENQATLEVVLEGLHQKGKTLIVSTHDMDFAYRFSDRVIVMKEGKVIADKDSRQVFTNNEILETIGAKPPVILQVTKLLEEKGIIRWKGKYPKHVGDMERFLINEVIHEEDLRWKKEVESGCYS